MKRFFRNAVNRRSADLGPAGRLLVGALGSLLLGASAVSPAHAADPAPVKAPTWELKDVNGRTVKSSDFAGKVVIVDFWATWCPPCKLEIPGFVALQKKYGDKGFAMVGISVDQEGPAVVNPFIEKYGINYPILMADDQVVQAFGGIEGIPATFVIDRDGNLVAHHVGFTMESTFEKVIKAMLGKG